MFDRLRVLVIIQARVGSNRLPGKVLFDLEGCTVLERVVERVKASRLIDKVIIATTEKAEDQSILCLGRKIGIEVFCGSENDVLDRFYQAAKLYKAEHIVRITADCPLMDPQIINEVIALHLSEKADYTTNTLKETYPDGEDVEAICFKTLEKAWREARLVSEREHVTPYIRKNAARFKIVGLENDSDLSRKRWTLDNFEDYEFIKKIYNGLYDNDRMFGMKDVLALLAEDPSIEKLNHHINRNEGYAKSLREDKVINGKIATTL